MLNNKDSNENYHFWIRKWNEKVAGEGEYWIDNGLLLFNEQADSHLQVTMICQFKE